MREIVSGRTDQKVSSPEVLFNPFRLFPLLLDTSGSFLVAQDDHIWHLGSLAFAMNGIASGDGVTTTVPINGFGESTDGASVVKWDNDKAIASLVALIRLRKAASE